MICGFQACALGNLLILTYNVSLPLKCSQPLNILCFCRSVSCTGVSNPYHIKCLNHTAFTTLHVSPSSSCSCTPYNGNLCTSVFSAANITGSADSISLVDSIIDAAISAAGLSQSCQNYLRIIQCLTAYTPCTGTAWCGSMSSSQLTTALSNACGCTGTSCSLSIPTLTNYYQGSSSGGRVNNDMLTCQDVTLGKKC